MNVALHSLALKAVAGQEGSAGASSLVELLHHLPQGIPLALASKGRSKEYLQNIVFTLDTYSSREITQQTVDLINLR